jgi:hypothetical protein
MQMYGTFPIFICRINAHMICSGWCSVPRTRPRKNKKCPRDWHNPVTAKYKQSAMEGEFHEIPQPSFIGCSRPRMRERY